MRDPVAIIISPVWPGDDQGYRIAVKSSLYEYAQFFDRLFIVVLSEESRPSDLQEDPRISWLHVPVVRRKKWVRFARSLAGSRPGIVMQFVERPVIRGMRTRLVDMCREAQPDCVIFEDLPVASVAPFVRKLMPGTPFAIRTHNVHSEAFEGFNAEGSFAVRRAWSLEMSRIGRFEETALKGADRVWTISSRDAEETSRRYGVTVDGVVGIVLDHTRYSEVAHGSVSRVVSIGTADLRKAHGLACFMSETWPEVVARNNQARLLLAGRGTEAFSDADSRIEGLGFVEDDRSLLGSGRIFVNPQERGSGVKLKSIIAMLAGKALVSTPKGVEGVAGCEGRHFYVAENGIDMARIILRLISNPEECIETGRRARDLASMEYAQGRASGQTRNMFGRLID